ncbi:C45 family peptidase [Bacillus tianshenii]|uniref:C45 family autoproteolytic acyltransferase/hydolase n=1 Tax=Sutcliffiella tianshenii TaxID=1463404 RepID=UPI001CD4BEF7|nr:C45 family peptidase [Bacillus tianshenii]MCA1320553.1 C45 family peptidase [Bacillus tianshenii]
MDVLELRDTSFQVGYKTGLILKGKPILTALGGMVKPEIDIFSMQDIYSAYAPHLLEELQGLAEALNLSFEKAAALLSGYDLPKVEAMGCSAILTKDYYVRNYDFSPILYDGIFSMIQAKGSNSSAGYNLQAIGRHDGVNEHGLVAGLHFVSNESHTKGLCAWSSIRIVLDTCSSLEEAVHLLKEIPHAACYNFSISDGSGNLAVVEAGPEKVLVRTDEEYLTCVNHFQHDDLSEKNRPQLDGSKKRDLEMHQLQKRGMSHEDMAAYFADRNSPLFFKDYSDLFGTLHTFSYSWSNKRLITSVAQSNDDLDLDFGEWVRGANIDRKQLYGMIEENASES